MEKWHTTMTNLIFENISSGPIHAYVQLATIDGEWPRVRTIVFRGMLMSSKMVCSGKISQMPDGLTKEIVANLLVFSTDTRSRKIQEIRKNPRGEINWYFPTSRDQMRLQGYIHLIPSPNAECFTEFINKLPSWAKDLDLEQERLNLWEKQMSPALRASFAWQQPGSIREKDEGKDAIIGLPANPTDESLKAAHKQALDNFVLMLFEPVQVDLVRLGTNPPFTRLMWTRSEQGWNRQLVWP